MLKRHLFTLLMS